MSSLVLPVPFQVSFEFFPPKTAEMEETLWKSITRLAPLSPRFVSVTYGAGGSTRERTHQTVHRIRHETPLVPAAHLTCVAATRAEIDAVADDYWNVGEMSRPPMAGSRRRSGARNHSVSCAAIRPIVAWFLLGLIERAVFTLL